MPIPELPFGAGDGSPREPARERSTGLHAAQLQERPGITAMRTWHSYRQRLSFFCHLRVRIGLVSWKVR